MADQIVLIVTVALFSSLIKALLGDKGVGKTANTVISAVLLFCVISSVMKGIVYFGENIAIPVINENEYHINENKEDMTLYREWLAKETALEISEEIEGAVKKYTGITVEVEVPWHLEGDNVIFDILKVYTDCDERYYEKIKNTVKIHYQLDAECIKR